MFENRLLKTSVSDENSTNGVIIYLDLFSFFRDCWDCWASSLFFTQLFRLLLLPIFFWSFFLIFLNPIYNVYLYLTLHLLTPATVLDGGDYKLVPHPPSLLHFSYSFPLSHSLYCLYWSKLYSRLPVGSLADEYGVW